jgi:cytochrome c
MPYNAPGTLTDNEVYGVTAYLLHANKLVDSTTAINAVTLPAIVMPAQKHFVADDRKGGAEVK